MVGKIFTEHRATFAQLDMKKILKVVGRFIHNDAAGMKRIFDKAKAKKKAGEAVARAIQSLSAGGKTPPSPGLQFFHSIIAEVRVPPADLANRRMRAQLVDVRDRRNAQEMYTVAKENFEANPEIDEVG